VTDEPETRPRFTSDGPPFLDQGRAQSSLRHELEALFSAVESSMDAVSARDADVIVELSMVPNRIVARRGAFATSFSWLGGRLGGISDGHLLVIEWSGIATDLRGVFALKSATASRETSYRPEAANAESWCWRAADPAGRASTTRDLVGEWLL
jgi:hypothetical protein